MHEFSICRGLLDQVDRIAAAHGARRVARVTLRIGPLSGVETALLERAFAAARAGTVAATAELDIETAEVRVRCRACASETAAEPNRLVCASCGAHDVVLAGGDDLMLKNVELIAETPDETSETARETAHV